MFYSNDILNNPQHGVSTIWLVATVGSRAGTLKVTRKAIQEVNVQKACETILQPGAPLALRVQGNLLYGVSRVFAQQCVYVLGDAEKTRSDMQMFYRLLGQNTTDPTAGKVRREQLLLEDDPNFVLDPVIPPFNFDSGGNLVFHPSQASSRKDYSQLSLVNNDSISTGREGSIMGFNLSQSDGNSLHLASPFKLNSSAKKHTLEERMVPLEEVPELDGYGEVMFDIDAEGNIIGIAESLEEPQLPELPANPTRRDQDVDNEMILDQQELLIPGEEGQSRPSLNEDGFLMLDEELLPDAQDPQQQQLEPAAKALETQQAAAAAAPRADKFLDLPHMISNRERKDIWDGYLDRAAKERENKLLKVNATQARANAYAVSLGQGIGGVGQLSTIPWFAHPLANLFAGDALRNLVFGVREYNDNIPSDEPSEIEGSRRRSASEAFEDNELGENGRRVRPRLEAGTPQPGQEHQDADMGIIFEDDNNLPPEMGMEEQSALDDRMSSSLMPWNRTPSVHRPSSVVGFGSKQRATGSRQVTASPRGSVQPIERHSDVAFGSHHGSDLGFVPGHPIDSSFEEFGVAANVDTQEADDPQWIRSTLDTVSKDFLLYTTAQAKRTGLVMDNDTKKTRRWVEFEELACPKEHTKIVAAQAFHHVLTLATKSLITVDQEMEDFKPYGTIRVGVEVDDEASYGVNMSEGVSGDDDSRLEQDL